MAKKKKKSGKSNSKKNKPQKLKRQDALALRAEADGIKPEPVRHIQLPSKPNPVEPAPVTPVEEKGNPEIVPAVSPLKSVNREMAADSSKILAAAAAIAVMMLASALLMTSGPEAIKGIGGFSETAVPRFSAQVALMLDSLFPVFYGAGIAIFATSFRSRRNRPLVRLVLTSLLLVVVADFVENAMAFATMTGAQVNPLQWPFTVVKYAGIAFVAVLLSALIVAYDRVSQVVRFAARFVFPVGVAALISGIGGETVRSTLAVLFPISLLLLAQLAFNIGRRYPA